MVKWRAKERKTVREFDRRPWGTYTVLEEAPTFKVKRIEVLPGPRGYWDRLRAAAQ